MTRPSASLLLTLLPSALLALSDGSLPILRAPRQDPTLQGPQKVAYAFPEADAFSPPPQTGLTVRVTQPLDAFTFVVWTHRQAPENKDVAYTPGAFIHYPDDAYGKAVGTTYHTQSGTGTATLTATAQTAHAANGVDLRVTAYNLTCSEQTTLAIGDYSRTLDPGAHLGLTATKVSNGDSITVTPATDAGTWDIELAVPKTVRCYGTDIYTVDATRRQGVAATFFADQWTFATARLTVTNEVATLSLASFYPDGCVETNSLCTDLPGGKLPPGLCSPLAAYGGMHGMPIGETMHAWGAKAWGTVLTDRELQDIIKADAQELLRRGFLTQADLHPGETAAQASAQTLLSAKAKAATPTGTDPGHGHSPGNAPILPPFLKDDDSEEDAP